MSSCMVPILAVIVPARLLNSISPCFFKITFFHFCFKNTIRVSNSLDPDQAQHFAGPDLGPI